MLTAVSYRLSRTLTDTSLLVIPAAFSSFLIAFPNSLFVISFHLCYNIATFLFDWCRWFSFLGLPAAFLFCCPLHLSGLGTGCGCITVPELFRLFKYFLTFFKCFFIYRFFNSFSDK